MPKFKAFKQLALNFKQKKTSKTLIDIPTEFLLLDFIKRDKFAYYAKTKMLFSK